ncbi:MAG: hypothetical protein OK454_10675 [Thaumarchaeota archaeon]|nr:hypothetical protein [Nitrososphaerota archaeon]
MGGVLDVLLAVQQQTQQGAQEILDTVARWLVDDLLLELLRTEV